MNAAFVWLLNAAFVWLFVWACRVQVWTSAVPGHASSSNRRWDLGRALEWANRHLDRPSSQVSASTRRLAGKDTILEEDLCPMYYRGDADCQKFKSQVKFNHTLTQPTLEMGDPSNPVMFFFHGWPDTGGLWANQFEYFCMPPNGKYYCVAPTLTDFHPDFETAPKYHRFFDSQTDRMHKTAQEKGLKDMILVVHDWGAVVGYQYLYKYPHMVKKLISFDYGDNPIIAGTKMRAFGDAMIKTLHQYQQNIIYAYRTNNSTYMRAEFQYLKVAVWRGHEPKNFQSRAGWPYNCQVLDAVGEEMSERLAPDVPLDTWNFRYVPDYPDGIPILFLYGSCQDGTGCDTCPVTSCLTRSFIWHSDAWVKWVNERDDSKVVGVQNAGHWLMLQQSGYVNNVMDAWLEGNKVPAQHVTTSDENATSSNKVPTQTVTTSDENVTSSDATTSLATIDITSTTSTHPTVATISTANLLRASITTLMLVIGSAETVQFLL